MFKSGVGGSPFTERNFHPHTTRRFIRRTKAIPMKTVNENGVYEPEASEELGKTRPVLRRR